MRWIRSYRQDRMKSQQVSEHVRLAAIGLLSCAIDKKRYPANDRHCVSVELSANSEAPGKTAARDSSSQDRITPSFITWTWLNTKSNIPCQRASECCCFCFLAARLLPYHLESFLQALLSGPWLGTLWDSWQFNIHDGQVEDRDGR